MKAVQKTLDKYKPMNIASQKFKAVLQLSLSRDPQLNNKDAIETLQEKLSSELL